MKTSVLEKIFIGVIFTILVAYTISLLYPLCWTVVSSFKGARDFSHNPFGFPEVWKFSNYADIYYDLRVQVVTADSVRYAYLPEMIANSLIFTIGAAAAIVFTSSLTAYAVAKYKFFGRKILHSVAIITMILPIVGSLASSLRMMDFLGFRENVVGVWIMMAGGFGMNFLLLYSTFRSISWTYAEAAFIDGASHAKVFFTIMIPLAKGTFLALFVLEFIRVWNDYQTPLVYLKTFPTLSYGMFRFQFDASSLGLALPHIFAGFVVAMLPIVAVFLAFQKQIMSNVTAGGLKG